MGTIIQDITENRNAPKRGIKNKYRTDDMRQYDVDMVALEKKFTEHLTEDEQRQLQDSKIIPSKHKAQLTNGIPYHPTSEKIMLHAAFQEVDEQKEIMKAVRPDYFFNEGYRTVWEACVRVYEQEGVFTPQSVWHELHQMGVDNKVQAMCWTVIDVDNMSESYVWRRHADWLREAAIKRAVMTTAYSLQTMSADPRLSTEELLQEVQGRINEIVSGAAKQEERTTSDITTDYLERLAIIMQNPGMTTGVPTGYEALDDVTNGLVRGELVVVAARPGCGKSSMALSIAKNVAEAGYKVGIFSLEMSNLDLIHRLFAMEAVIDGMRLRQGHLDCDEYKRVLAAKGKIDTLNIKIEDTQGLTISDIQRRARSIKAEHGLDVLIVDYLQLVRGSSRREQNRVVELGEVANGLKALAKDMDIAVLACAQLNREVDRRPDHIPHLSDLRESGDIEQAADIVAFLVREELYDKETDKHGIVDIYIRKNRSGRVGEIQLGFDAYTTHFHSLATNNMYSAPY